VTEVFLKLPEGFPCFFLSCKANARVKLAKTGHDPHSSIVFVFFGCYYLCCLVVICVVLCTVCVCKCVLPPGDDPIAVNKYININYSSIILPFDSVHVCNIICVCVSLTNCKLR